MAKPELGTKRVCPETGRKFYDLNKDPIVSPYTGKSYPLSFFDDTKSEVIEEKATVTEAESDDEDDAIADDSTEVLSLDDADDEATGSDEDKNLPDLGDNTDDEVLEDDADDDTFLPDDDEDDGDDVSGIVDISTDDDD
ncbi:MAG: TIGR02300 family protein [Pseudomonadota bacterium]